MIDWDPTTPVYVAGTRTLLGAACRRRLLELGFTRVGPDQTSEPAPTDAAAVRGWLLAERPRALVCAAGDSGGIGKNTRLPADLMIDNLRVLTALLPAALEAGVPRLLYLGSSCMYPKAAPQPMAPDALWAGALEPTSRAYATARLAGVELVRALRIQYGVGYIAAIPADAFGPDEPFDAENAHVVPALIRRCVEAREQGARSLTVWGSGRPVRELIYADDVADACLCLLERYDDPAPINIGSGWEMSVAQLAETIRDIVGYRGELQFDPGKPDGAPRKTFDSTRLAALGWKPRWQLRDALRATYEAYCKQRETQHAS